MASLSKPCLVTERMHGATVVFAWNEVWLFADVMTSKATNESVAIIVSSCMRRRWRETLTFLPFLSVRHSQKALKVKSAERHASSTTRLVIVITRLVMLGRNGIVIVIWQLVLRSRDRRPGRRDQRSKASAFSKKIETRCLITTGEEEGQANVYNWLGQANAYGTNCYNHTPRRTEAERNTA